MEDEKMEEPVTKNQHVVPYEGKWGVRAQKSEIPSKLFESKILATAYAFEIADNNDGMVIIHNEDGTFKEVKKTENSSKLITSLKA
ncbi:DUF2188 domain-containing protein [Candidatus Woesearchaeota archaeon]|nr:DUF2188 domain-containing protein [Candidatus Woesearchaeota archaeon]